MSYSFVAAKFYTVGAMTQPRAICVHMAEGGGTVGWLTHPTNDNSSHFVVEYSGRVVQMVKETDASHSLHIARPYGAPGAGDFGTFSLDTAKAVLGLGIADPNRYLFAVEIEGYAATGPNHEQVIALAALVKYLRTRHPSIRGLLGHRDFQDEKACPGGHIPWATLGGHGLFLPKAVPQEAPVRTFTVTGPSGTITVKGDAQHWAPTLDGVSPNPKLPAGLKINNALPIHLAARIPGGLATANRSDGYLVVLGGLACIVLAMDCTATAPVVPVTDCTAAVKEAVAPLNTQIGTLKAGVNTAYNLGLTTAQAAVSALPRR